MRWRPRPRWGVIAVLVGALGWWLVVRTSPKSDSRSVASDSREVATASRVTVPRAVRSPGTVDAEVVARVQGRSEAAALRDAGGASELRAPPHPSQNLRDAHDHPDPAPGGSGVVPHPLDEARRRTAEQHRLFSQVKQAIKAQRYAEARRLLQLHDSSFDAREAWQDLREGYQLIVDCRELGTEDARARGRRFVDEQRGSTLRRAVRRACLQ